MSIASIQLGENRDVVIKNDNFFSSETLPMTKKEREKEGKTAVREDLMYLLDLNVCFHGD